MGPDAAIDLTRRLIRVPTADAAGCRTAAAIVEAEFAALGIPTERHDVPGAGGERFPTVLGWLGDPTTTPDLVLNAHLDTSPPGPGWTADPLGAERRDGRIWGRGATVAKGDVAAYIHGAAAAAEASRGGSVLVAITADEGFGGGAGPGFLLGELGITPARALTAGITHHVAYATNGAVQLRVAVRGRSSHQALIDPVDDAMRHAVALAAEIAAMHDALAAVGCSVPGIAHPTINVTQFHAGVGFGMAPGTVELDIDRRVTPDEDYEVVLAELEAWMTARAARDRVAVEYAVVSAPRPLKPTSEGREWAGTVAAEAEAVLGSPATVGGIPLFTDARWFGAAGIPTALFGAGESDLVAAGINGVDESVREADIAAAIEVVARLVARVPG